MLQRYAHPRMLEIWSDTYRFGLFLKIECLVAEAQEKSGILPKGVAEEIKKKSSFNVDRIAEIEKEVHHETLAFLTNVSETINSPAARFLHYGLTSNDILDTAFCLQLVAASDILIASVNDFLLKIKKKAFDYKNIPVMGRSHGVHGEPITFGLRWAGIYSEWQRNLKRLHQAKQEIAVCMISGAMGNFLATPPSVEEYVAEQLGLSFEPVSTQVIARDRFAQFFVTLAVLASSIERLSINLRLMQITEVSETQEFFSAGQKGSSAMPHKRNPILSENLTGLARVIRAQALPALENVALWFERDMSHSSAERFSGPDATATLDFAIRRMTKIVDNLVVFPENMAKNIEKTQGLSASQSVLLALVRKDFPREEGYRLVQKAAQRTWEEKISFEESLKTEDALLEVLTKKEIETLCCLEDTQKHIDEIFKRVFGKEAL